MDSDGEGVGERKDNIRSEARHLECEVHFHAK